MRIKRLLTKSIRPGKSRGRRGLGNLISISTFCIVLIASLGMMGVSYASWNQSFSLFDSVATGDANVVVRDVALESSDGYESGYFNTSKNGGAVDEVQMEFVTDANPFNSILVFTVENNGTVPVVCEAIDTSVPDSLTAEIVEAPEMIGAGQTAQIKVRLTKGYCEDFEFSTFLKFVQAVD